jgi:archaemetzincin
MGPIPQGLLSGLAQSLGQVFDRACSILLMPAIPTVVYDPRRRQYRGEGILAALACVQLPEAERALGVIDADCYTPGLNFIFGQACIHGRDAFIALPRLRPSFHRLAENETLFRQRVLKEAVHELGHTYGLKHCPDRHCVMHFSNSLHDTDVKDHQFCPQCRARLDRALGTR